VIEMRRTIRRPPIRPFFLFQSIARQQRSVVTGKFLNENAEKPFKRVGRPELFHKLIDG